MKFIVTQEMGKLVKWLRIFGFDTEYFKENKSSTLIIQALRDERIIITRNHRLPKPSGIKIVLVKSEKIKEQILEVLKELKMSVKCDMMFRRCVFCNLELAAIDKGEIKDQIPEYVFKTQESFFRCSGCRRIYWAGTHWGNVKKTLTEIGL